MFDWDKACKITRITLAAALSLAVLTWTSTLIGGALEDVFAKPGYDVMDNLMKAYLRVDGYIAAGSLMITVASYIFYRIARTKRWTF
jgi:hypothetical protein